MIESHTETAIPDATEDSADGAEPIEMLVQLAEDGEIDPWDIDIVSVTEEFLAALDEGDIRESARALFYASVLLRLKSKTLLTDATTEDQPAEPEPRGAFFDQPAADHPAAGDPIDALEAEMDRRIARKDARGSPETLDELVRELREAERESWWKESREYETTETTATGPVTVDYGSPPDTAAAATAEPTPTDRAHDEQLEETITAVQDALTTEFAAGRDAVLFHEIRTVGPTPVRTFLGVLFLTHRGQLHIEQDELFGDLWLLPPS